MQETKRSCAGTVLSLASTLALLAVATAQPAEANSRFTVQNDSGVRVNIKVYNGNDTLCNVPAKTRHIEADQSKEFGCQGGGNQQCKVFVYNNTGTYCENIDANDCVSVKVPNKATLVIDQDRLCDINK